MSVGLRRLTKVAGGQTVGEGGCLGVPVDRSVSSHIHQKSAVAGIAFEYMYGLQFLLSNFLM